MSDPTILTSPGPGLYVHVPFCLRKCDYCDFYSFAPGPGDVSAYLQRLDEELGEKLDTDRAPLIKSVFLGGGNPTALGSEGLSRLLEMLRRRLEAADIVEWTVESNPETLSADVCRCLALLPNVRLSLGLQRLHDNELAFLGRNSTVEQGLCALDRALTVTPNVGVDLILGVPGRPFDPQPLERLLERFPIAHLSAYLLSLEAGTPLAARADAGEFGDPDDVGAEDLFLVDDLLTTCGFSHYELSNFARAGRACAHNLNSWLGGDYLGVGPAAVGTWGGIRTENAASLTTWATGRGDTHEILTPADLFRERIMLELRLLAQGLDLTALARRFPEWTQVLEPALERNQQEGTIRRERDRAILTRRGIPVADRILTDLFDVIP